MFDKIPSKVWCFVDDRLLLWAVTNSVAPNTSRTPVGLSVRVLTFSFQRLTSNL